MYDVWLRHKAWAEYHYMTNDIHGVSIGNMTLNSYAYADDVTLFCTTASGLQNLIDKCYMYSNKWRFNFGIKKTKCMVIGKSKFSKYPEWYLGSQRICVSESLEILGTVFTGDYKHDDHVNARIRKCRQSFYSLTKCGMAFPGATTDVKTYLWKSMCVPVLMYGIDGISISKTNVKRLDITQGNLVKQSMGLSKRSHTTELFAALGINRSQEIVNHNLISLYHRIFNVNTPLLNLTSHFLSMYITSNLVIPGTILSIGLSPVHLMYNKPHPVKSSQNGHIDSIQSLIYHENFMKPYSDEHLLVHLLTKSF